MKVKFRCFGIVITILISAGVLIFFLLNYNRQIRISYTNQKQIIEHSLGITIPGDAIVTDYYVGYKDESPLWSWMFVYFLPYTPEEMTEEGIVYIDDELYESLPNEIINQLWIDEIYQELYIEFTINSRDYEQLLPISDNGDESFYRSDYTFSSAFEWYEVEDYFSFPDYSEMRTTASNGETYQIRAINNNRMIISKPQWGKRKVAVTVSFTKWELEQLGIDSIPNAG